MSTTNSDNPYSSTADLSTVKIGEFLPASASCPYSVEIEVDRYGVRSRIRVEGQDRQEVLDDATSAWVRVVEAVS